MLMDRFKIHNFIKVLTLFAFTAITFEYWETGFWGTVILLLPYVSIFFIANKHSYNTNILTFS